MLRPSRKLIHAIEAVVDIAYHGGSGPVRSSEISERQGIPRRYLEQVLQQLVHDGILSGHRGPRGGYNLTRERRRISVGEIVRVVQRLDNADSGDDDSSALAGKVVRPALDETLKEAMERLDSLTVQDLCDRAGREGISRAASVPDFTI